jgi:hypothetical protein
MRAEKEGGAPTVRCDKTWYGLGTGEQRGVSGERFLGRDEELLAW